MGCRNTPWASKGEERKTARDNNYGERQTARVGRNGWRANQNSQCEKRSSDRNNDALADNALKWIVGWQRKYDREMHALDSASMGCRNTPAARGGRKERQRKKIVTLKDKVRTWEETEGGQVQTRYAEKKLWQEQRRTDRQCRDMERWMAGHS